MCVLESLDILYKPHVAKISPGLFLIFGLFWNKLKVTKMLYFAKKCQNKSVERKAIVGHKVESTFVVAYFRMVFIFD